MLNHLMKGRGDADSESAGALVAAGDASPTPENSLFALTRAQLAASKLDIPAIEAKIACTDGALDNIPDFTDEVEAAMNDFCVGETDPLDLVLAQLVNGARTPWRLAHGERGREDYIGASGHLNGFFAMTESGEHWRTSKPDMWKRLQELADATFASRLALDMVLWHGHGPAKAADLVPGSASTGHGFFSTSLSRTRALTGHAHAIGQTQRITRCVVRAGQPGLYVAGKREAEVIFPPGSTLIITARDVVMDGPFERLVTFQAEVEPPLHPTW